MSDNAEGNRNLLATLPDIYSRRKRLARGTVDPLRYNEVPVKVRTQIVQIVNKALQTINPYSSAPSDRFYKALRNLMRMEQGSLKLAHGSDAEQEVTAWFLRHDVTDDVVDCIECMCKLLLHMAPEAGPGVPEAIESRIDAINARLLEAGIGFQFEGDSIIEASSRYLHSEVIVPTLELLSGENFSAANAEFLAAHKAFREQDYEQCLVECCKAFESVIKVIASERKWELPSGASAKALVKAVFDNGLIPEYLSSEFAGIRAVLENGIGTVRNKSGGHGAGTNRRVVPRHLAAFQLHQTGAAIALLADAHLSEGSGPK